MTDYKVEFELVQMQHLHLYSNADPRYYSNTTQVVPNSEIPDEHWHPVSREGDEESCRDQHAKLKEWADADTGFVRNPRLYKLAAQPQWEEIQ